MSKGPAGYGRYDDDPEYVGCPWAKSDMTPCVARDGAICLSTGTIRVCVGCNHTPAFLLRDLAGDYEPAREPVSARYASLTASQVLYRAVSDRLGGARAAVIVAMHHGEGMSYGQIAEATGLTRPRAQQLAERGKPG